MCSVYKSDDLYPDVYIVFNIDTVNAKYHYQALTDWFNELSENTDYGPTGLLHARR